MAKALLNKAGLLDTSVNSKFGIMVTLLNGHLAATDVPYTFDMLTASMTEAAFTGYAAFDFSTATILGPFADPVDGSVYYKVLNVQFDNTGTDPVTVYALYMIPTGSASLEAYLHFDTPFTILPGGTLLMNVVLAIASGHLDSEIELLSP